MGVNRSRRPELGVPPEDGCGSPADRAGIEADSVAAASVALGLTRESEGLASIPPSRVFWKRNQRLASWCAPRRPCRILIAYRVRCSVGARANARAHPCVRRRTVARRLHPGRARLFGGGGVQVGAGGCGGGHNVSDERCETCAHVEISVIPAQAGFPGFSGRPAYLQLHCRRYPPSGNATEAWPRVRESDWCGEWAERIKRHPPGPCPLCRGESGTWVSADGVLSMDLFKPCDGCDGTGFAREPEAPTGTRP